MKNSAKAKGKEKVASVERVSSGIPGLDGLIGGGFIPNDVYLITGGTGCGKTLFCCQFIWEGLQKGENGIYFSLEEMPKDVLHDAEVFGWDFQKYIDQKKFLIEYQDPFEMADITTLVKEKINKFKAKRVVIDSTSIFGMVLKDVEELRKRLYELIKALKQTDTVVLLTGEVPSGSDSLSRFGVEEFVVDGIIVLHHMEFGSGESSPRSLIIKKMRRTKHGEDVYPLKFTSKGLEVQKD